MADARADASRRRNCEPASASRETTEQRRWRQEGAPGRAMTGVKKKEPKVANLGANF